MLRSTISGSSSGGPPQQNIAEIINLLESSNVSVIEETTTLVRDSLTATSDSWLLNGLIDYYITSGNVIIRRLLTGIRQPQHKNLLLKVDEYLQKPSTRYVALNLFGHIIRKDPSWIHQLIQSRAFATVIKCLQLDNDVAALTVAMYVITTLLPKVPTQMAHHLNHLFGIYVRLVSWKIVRGTDASELNLANFDNALRALFLCLYGLYPCSFVEYLQKYYCKAKTNQVSSDAHSINIPATTPGEEQFLMERMRHEIFKTRVQPMLKQVRMNPNLILYTKELEVLNDKWRKMESHDIVAEISQIPIEGKHDKLAAYYPVHETPQAPANQTVVKASSSSTSLETVAVSSASEPQSDSVTIWSPSMEIGLSTPPPSRGISPTREVSDDKVRSESIDKTPTKSKARPDTLALSHNSFKSGNLSTPCTPTLPSLSFEYEKSDEFLPSESAANAPSTSVVKNEIISGESSGVANKTQFDFSTSVVNQKPPLSPSDHSGITEFSPALLPSSDHLSTSVTTENAPKLGIDTLFIGSEKPSVKDILELANANLLRSISSSELLDKEIQFALQKETPKRSTDDWLHFGHGPLNEKDSQTLLAGYMQMQCALFYEQHSRQQHAMRARRLMRKVYESSALEQRNKALKETLSQKENEISQLQLLVKTLKSEFSKQEEGHQDSLDILRQQSAKLSSLLRSTEDENSRLKLEKCKDMADLKKALDSRKESEAELFKCKLQLQADAKNKETNQELRAQIVQLQKEMLIVEELGRKMEDLQQNELQFKVAKSAEHEMLIQSYKKQVENLTNDLRKVSTVRDAMTGKAKEMEKMLEKKNAMLEEQKKYLENVKSLARSQIQAMESKYQAQKNITMRMEVKIMELFSKLTALEGQTDSSETVTATASKPIQQPPSSIQYRYSHLTEASPALSPPIKAGMMDEVTVATSELEATTSTEG